ncbi:MAG: hypothetical protein LBC07_04500 [Elusimicrobiota bacterium]|jgi:hypothetical protein|nr:hypothetical protein [Elusimicrobiota bacterium]
MRFYKLQKYFLFVFLTLAIFFCTKNSQAAFSSVQQAADTIAKSFAANPHLANKKIVVIGFSGLPNSKIFSQIIESELTTSFIKVMPGKIAARIYINEILEELQFSNTDIFSEESRKRIGLLSSADVIVSGNYRLGKDNLSLTVQAIDLETGIAFASKKVEIKKSAVHN